MKLFSNSKCTQPIKHTETILTKWHQQQMLAINKEIKWSELKCLKAVSNDVLAMVCTSTMLHNETVPVSPIV